MHRSHHRLSAAASTLLGTLALSAATPDATVRDANGDDRGQERAEASAPLPFPADDAQSRAARAALERGLAWLAEGQNVRGSGVMPTGAGDEVEFAVPIATTALGALALMAGGNAYERGPYGTNVARAIDYLVAHSNLDPNHPEHGFIESRNEPEAAQMHSFGYATLALAEAWATSPRTEAGRQIGEALVAAVRLIERTQTSKGGWHYKPRDTGAHEGSITITLVQALRSARNAGVAVDASVVTRAERYVHASQRENGLMAYQLGDPDAHTSVALTAAGVATLYSVGEYAGDAVDLGLAAIRRELADRAAGTGTRSRYPFYERFYLAEAYWHNGDPSLFADWSAKEFQRLLADQNDEGYWRDPRYGHGYATAVNCLVLAMSEELLPIFQR